MTRIGRSMVVARSGTTPVVLILACAILCPAALAADEEAPPTGTIEVEVVYKDTGEPVNSVLVLVARGHRHICLDVASGGRLSVPVGEIGRDDTYSVAIRHVPLGERWGDAKSSTFLAYKPELLQEVTFSPGQDVATVRFEVQRGWRVQGTVRRQDGTPLAGGSVVILQDASKWRMAFGVTQPDGLFDMLGVGPTRRADVIVSAPPPPSADVVGSAPVLGRSIDLTGELTSLDLEVQTVKVTLVVDVLKPLWPFPSEAVAPHCVGTVWVGRPPEAGESPVHMRIFFTEPSSERRALRTTRYNISLGELPAQYAVTTRVGFAEPKALSRFPWSLSSCSERTVELGTESQTIRLRAYLPYARLSRALWYGAVPVILLLIFVPILVRQARRRRAEGGPPYNADAREGPRL
jgi:hypothetical protein